MKLAKIQRLKRKISQDSVVNLEDDLSILETSNEYSTTEIKVGKWINGKPIYRKAIYIASLPNHNTVAYPTGINNVDIIIDLYGIAHAQSGHNFPLPYVSMFSNNAENIEITYLSGTEVRVVTGSDRSSLSAHIIIEYTKTTD